ncbi:Mitochondrial distribution and morphology protein 31, mitochondrial precursor [Marasmius crinis-equi]|uniref:Mitochondrial distribution and morphology protein 31, mitochondrial n=1 Tax=Marasmius crinis-equi TaxID=585013 RepID=A0ABR3FQ07_9AGAR
MSLRICGNSSRISRPGLSTIPSRTSHDTLDRYRTIRRFFIGQHVNISIPSGDANTLVNSINRHPTTRSLQNSFFQRSRQLHFTNLSSYPGKKGTKARRGDSDEDKFGAATSSSVESEATTDKLEGATENHEDTQTASTAETTAPPEQGNETTPPQVKTPESTPESKPYILPYNFSQYSKSFRQLALSVPHFHRPTRDDFLRVADGFWQRLRIRFKWFTIKSFRRYNADDISGFITWFIMSQTVWILVGTTTFFSVIFAIVNSLRLQNSVARAISDYLTSETGVTVIFESAIVPKWKDSRISFKNVYISRRPQSMANQRRKVKEHQSALGYDVSNHPAYHHVNDDEDEGLQETPDEDCNYTMYDLNIGSIDVTLSLWRWLDGKGLIESAAVKGVRGIIDRRSVQYDPDHPLDPSSFRHPYQPGDFELESLELEDVLLTIYQPGGFRPHTASIFRADIHLFRKRWLFYDFLSAENIVGQFDNCLFSLHKPQSIGRTNEMDLQDGEWARMSRIRIDGVNIDHLQAAASAIEGPVAWITSGKLDAVLDIKFPQDPEHDINDILEDIADAISTTVLSNPPDPNPALQRIPGQRELAKPPLSAPELETDSSQDQAEPKVVIDIDLRFRDVKAAVPIFTDDISYVNNALIRPIVAFMNANRTLVPIHCRVVKPLNDFDGAWTMWETGLMDEISLKIYDALAHHVTQANFNRRIKTVSVWSLQKTANAVLSALRHLADPMSARLRETYAKLREASDDEGVLVFDPNVLNAQPV